MGWERDGCIQTIIIQLTHEVFDSELQKLAARLAIAYSKMITAEMVRSIICDMHTYVYSIHIYI